MLSLNFLLLQIEGFDDGGGRIVIKLAIGGLKVTMNEFMAQPVSKQEFAKYGKILSKEDSKQSHKLCLLRFHSQIPRSLKNSAVRTILTTYLCHHPLSKKKLRKLNLNETDRKRDMKETEVKAEIEKLFLINRAKENLIDMRIHRVQENTTDAVDHR